MTRTPANRYAESMLDYARERARVALSTPRTVVLATSGPAGVEASEFPFEAIGLDLYLLVPKTSDHLFNLEQESNVTLLAAEWELKGKAQIIAPVASELQLNLLQSPDADWCVLVRVEPYRIQIRSKKGWGNLETIDLKSSPS
jgi:hypothetical protein